MKLVVGIWCFTPRYGAWKALTHSAKLALIDKAAAVVSAQVEEKPPEDQQVCGILAGPEYAFTLVDDSGSMQLGKAEATQLKACLTETSAKFPKILLVPGSISFRRTYDVSKPNDAKQAGKLNLRLIAHDAALKTADFLPTKIKEEDVKKSKDNRDFMKNSVKPLYDAKEGTFKIAKNYAYGYLGGTKVFTCRKRGEVGEIDPSDKDTIFVNGNESTTRKLDKLDYGIEICKDAANGYMKKFVQKLDVYMVLSAGLDTKHITPPDYQLLIHAAENRVDGGVVTKKEGVLTPARTDKTTGYDLDIYNVVL